MFETGVVLANEQIVRARVRCRILVELENGNSDMIFSGLLRYVGKLIEDDKRNRDAFLGMVADDGV